MVITTNEQVAIRTYPKPVVDSNGKGVAQDFDQETFNTRIIRNNRRKREEIGGAVSSVEGTYTAYFNCNLRLREGDEIFRGNGQKLVVRETEKKRWDNFLLVTAVCEVA